MDVKNILNQLANFTMADVEFYNPKVAHMKLNISLNTGCIQVSMSDALDHNFTGRPQKNQKLFDHDNKVFFSLSPFECSFISRNMQALMNGTFTNPNPKDNMQKAITVNHFDDNNLSKFAIERIVDKDGKVTGLLKVVIFPPKNRKGKTTYYTLRGDELVVFRNFINHGATDLPYNSAILKGFIKAFNKATFDVEEYMKKNGGAEKKPYSAKKEEVTAFDDSSDEVEDNGDESNDSVEEDAFGVGSADSSDMFGFN